MPSFKSLLPLVLIASTALAVPQSPNPFAIIQNLIPKKLTSRNNPDDNLVYVNYRRGVSDTDGRGAGGNGGDGGQAGPAGAGTKYGYGGNGAKGGAGGSGGTGDYFSGKLIKEEGRDRAGERGSYGEERLGGFDEYAYKPNGKGNRLYYRRDTYTYDGQGGKGGSGGGGSNGGEGKEFGRGGKGAEGGAGGNAGRGNFFKGVEDDVAEGGAYKSGRKSGEEYY